MNEPPVPRCAFCGQPGSFEEPIIRSDGGLSFISEPFPTHVGCVSDFVQDQARDHYAHAQDTQEGYD